MRHLRLSVLSVLAAALLGGFTVPLRVSSPRRDMVVKHKWDDIPDNWISRGPPPDDTTIELHIALQPKHKNALIDVLYEVSQPGHPKRVFFTTPHARGLIACTACSVQIWRSLFKGGGRRACRTTPQHARARELVA